MRWRENMKFMGNFLILWENKGNRNLSPGFVSFGNNFYWFEIVYSKMLLAVFNGMHLKCFGEYQHYFFVWMLYFCSSCGREPCHSALVKRLRCVMGTSYILFFNPGFLPSKKSKFKFDVFAQLVYLRTFFFLHTVGWGIRWRLAISLPACCLASLWKAASSWT